MANLRLSVGSLPLGVEDIEPSTDGSSPSTIQTPVGGVSGVVPLIVWCDTAGYERSTDLVIPPSDTRVRFSADGVTWGGWNEGVTIPAPISVYGTQFYMQARGLTGDSSNLPIKVVISQDGITESTSTELPDAFESSTNADDSTLNAIALMELSSEWVIGGVLVPRVGDSSSMGYGGLISTLPSVTEDATNSEVITFTLVGVLANAADNATSSDSSNSVVAVIATGDVTDNATGSEVAPTLVGFLAAPALTDLTPTSGGFTVTVGTVTGATNYDLQYTLDTDTTWASATIAQDVGSGAEAVTGLTGGSLYKVRARTVNATGDGAWGSSQTVTPTAGESVTTADMFFRGADPSDFTQAGTYLGLTSFDSTHAIAFAPNDPTDSTPAIPVSMGYCDSSDTAFDGAIGSGTLTSALISSDGVYTATGSIVVSADVEIPSGKYLGVILSGQTGSLYMRYNTTGIAKVKAGTYTTTMKFDWFIDYEGAPDYLANNPVTDSTTKIASLQFVTR